MPRAENPSVSVPSDVAVPTPETLCFLLAPLGLSVIAACRRLSGGASQESWRIDGTAPDGSPESFVLRRTPAATWNFDLAAGIETEAGLMRLAGAAGVPSPAVAALLDGTEGLGRGFVMGFVAGETLGHKIVRDPAFAAVRPALAGQCGRVLAAIHGIDADGVPGLRLQTAEAQVAALADLHAGGGWV
ncbi:phosphotransferase, partial [Zavarzinia sp.]|uniref:phosphotransferase n=1 Tax=Zavarzinia sp. TaxID=2027920 RepID=UPI003568D476